MSIQNLCTSSNIWSPNVTGTCYIGNGYGTLNMWSSDSPVLTGAYKVGTTRSICLNGSNATSGDIDFDASLSDNRYTNNSALIPLSLCFNYIIKI